MPVEKLTPSFTFTEERLQALQAVAPEAFADGQVNWETLKAALEPFLEDEGSGTEHFGLFWPGKRQARRLAAQPSKGTLRPVPGQGINEDTTRNLFIEGDNLEVLKLLQKSYAGRVKLIYIDPPYNTGNDFVYKDDFREPLEDYLKRTGQADAEGLLTTNPKAGGRFHSNWLNMMLPRLMLARTLLSEDGVIFVSIDDNEVHNLRQIMSEVFGEENFVNMISIKAKPPAGASGGGEDRRLKKNIEFVLLYTKNRDTELDNLYISNSYEKSDLIEHIYEMKNQGKSWKYTRAMISTGEKEFIKKIQDGSGSDILIYRHNSFIISSLSELINISRKESESLNEDIILSNTYQKFFDKIFRDTNAQSSIRTRVMDTLGEEDGLFSIEYTPRSGKNRGKQTTVYYRGKNKDQIAWLSDIAEIINNKISMRTKIGTLWDNFNWNNVSKEGDIAFPNGKKPIAFIQQMIELGTKYDNNDIILDFFSGSSSTAHAIMELNIQDGGNRQFIMIQLGEPITSSEQATVAELSKKRIKNSIQQILNNKGGLSLQDNIDLGFAVYRLDRSHFKAWQDYDGPPNPDAIDDLFSRFEDPLTPGWQPRALLDEVLLLQGFPLDSRRTRLKDYSSNVLVRIECDWFSYRLFVCLDSALHPATLDQLPLDPDDKFICLDSALTDQTKQQLTDRCTLVVI